MSEVFKSSSSIINKNVFLGSKCVIEPYTILGHPELWTNLDYINHEKNNIDEIFKTGLVRKVTIGDNSVIRTGTIIYENVFIGHNFQCGSNVIIREACKIGNDTYIKNNAEIMRNVSIGNNCRIAGSICDYTEIGNSVFSYGMIIHKQNSGITEEERRKAPKIGNNVLIGRGAVIIGDIVIGNNVTIGANSVVTKNIPSNSKVLGINNVTKKH